MKIKENFKRFVTGTLCLTTFAMFQPTLPAYAEQESEEFKYTMFASSNEEGAITVNSNNFTINGQIATNGTVNCTGNTNINYENSNNICVDMVYIPNKIDSDFFDGRKVDCIENDYNIEETNIDVSSPLSVNGITTMQGNVTIQAGIKSKDDICISGDVKNSYNTVIYSQYGDINIDCNNVSLNGLIYAPFGTIHITASNLNMNDTMIIANKIIIDAPNVNINYSEHFGAYFNEISDKMEIPEEDFCYLEDLNNNNIPDFFENSINWKYIDDTDGDGIPDIIEISTGTDPEMPDSDINDILDNYTLEMMYKNPLLIWNNESSSLNLYGDLNSDYIIDAFDLVLMRQMIINNDYSKYADLDDDGDVDIEDLNWLSNYLLLKVKSFPVYNRFDSDKDGLTDYVEVENYGTSPHKADTDGDGLNDYFELFLMKTDPLIPDNIAGEDPDNDELTNEQESKYNTNPNSDDTDGDGLSDLREIELGTDPLLPDTDGDGLSDYDEVEVLKSLSPTNANTNGTPDSKRLFIQNIAEDDSLLSEVNTEDNAYALSISINASGNAKKLLNVEKSGYTNVMKDGSAVGFIPEFSYPDVYDIESITLNFRIKDDYKSSVMNIFAGDGYKSYNDDSLDGINRFMIFKYFEDIDMQMPIEKVCKVDETAGVVSVTLPKDSFEKDYDGYSVHNIGSYALVDLEVWGMMMNNNLMSDEDIKAYSNNTNISTASINIDTANSENGIDTQNLVDDSLNSIIGVMKNYSKITYNTNVNNNFDTKVIGGHVYAAIIDNRSTWDKAKCLCEKMGGHLMTISSDTELNALQYYLTPGNTNNLYWLGISCNNKNVWSQVSEDTYNSNKEANKDYLSKIGATIHGTFYKLDDFRNQGYGYQLYYADRLSYYPGARKIGESGYICEWNSYLDYLNYLRNSAKESNKSYVSSYFGTFILDGVEENLRNIDTDKDGISDYDELNWKLLHAVNGKGSNSTSVSYVNIYEYLSKSPVSSVLVSNYSVKSKVNKAFNNTAVTTASPSQNPGTTTTVVGTASVATLPVIPMGGESVCDDIDGDYIQDDNEEFGRKKKFDPTPVDMEAIDDTDMFNEYITFNGESSGTITAGSRYERKVNRYTKGGGTNIPVDMKNGNNKIATIYNRDNQHDGVKFLVEEDGLASCIIVEIVFESESEEVRDSIYEDENFVKFYKKINKNTDLVMNREKINNNKPAIRYTLETDNNQDYILDINDKIINTNFLVKIYKETYMYAPSGGIAFKDMVFYSSEEMLLDYHKVYINGDKFKEISHYDFYYSDEDGNPIPRPWNMTLANEQIAEELMFNLNNDKYNSYDHMKSVENDISVGATIVGFAMLVVQGSHIIGDIALLPEVVGKIVSGAPSTIGNISTVVGAVTTVDVMLSSSKENVKQDLANTLTESLIEKCIKENNDITRDYLLTTDMHNDTKGALDIIKDPKNLNMSFEAYNLNNILNSTLDWDTWDGNYINRVMGHSVLYVVPNLEIKNVSEIFN